jgi:hypothetical protein
MAAPREPDTAGLAGEDPIEPADRPESEPLPDDRRYSEIFGLPAMILVFAAIALVKGIADQNLGFAIVGAVVAAGVLLAIGFSMAVAKREDRPPPGG